MARLRINAWSLGNPRLWIFSVDEKKTGDWVGRVGPWKPEGWPSLECGWAIAKDHWGKGYAPEAAIASVNWIFETFPDLPRIISLIDPGNANSQAVARKIGKESQARYSSSGAISSTSGPRTAMTGLRGLAGNLRRLVENKRAQ